MRKAGLAIAMAAGLPAAAAAEVKSAAPLGFEVESRVVVPANPKRTYQLLRDIGRWWSPQHTYSGSAANLSLQLRAGACFCETLPGGGTVEHMRVVYADPGKMLRLQGGLGPLQAQAAAGTLTFTLKPVGQGTEVTLNYIVGGYIRGGADKLASPVDKVLAEQLARFRDASSTKM